VSKVAAELPRPHYVVDMAVASVKSNDNVELMGIPRDDWADTWHGHNTNWANESFSGAGQRLISSCCVLLHANRLHRGTQSLCTNGSNRPNSPTWHQLAVWTVGALVAGIRTKTRV